jgi:hypothetical protein
VPAALSHHEHPLPSLSSSRCSLEFNTIGDAGTAALSEALKRNAMLMLLE